MTGAYFHHSNHEHHHSHHHHHTHSDTNERKLIIVIALTGIFFVIEIIGGWLTHSLALLSDAVHMFTDVMALVIALIAIQLGKRVSDNRRTYGYRRFEILAAALNAFLLFQAGLYILYEAYKRFQDPPVVQTNGMFVIAVVGLIINLVGMLILRRGNKSNLNMRGAYLELLSDTLGSIGVIIGAVAIHFTGWHEIDPILAVLIGFLVIPRTWRLLSESLNILLEGVPDGIELQQIREELAALPDVKDVHDLHIWAITSGQNSLTAHLLVHNLPNDSELLKQAQQIAQKHDITHTNFQIEQEHAGSLCETQRSIG